MCIKWNLRKLDEVNTDFRSGVHSLPPPWVTCVFMCLAIVYINIMYMTSDCVEQARGTSTIPGVLQTAFENVSAIFLFFFIFYFFFVFFFSPPYGMKGWCGLNPPGEIKWYLRLVNQS